MADGYVIGQEVYNCRPTWHGKNVTMAALKRLRLAMLEHEFAQARLQHNMILATDGGYIVRPMSGSSRPVTGRCL